MTGEQFYEGWSKALLKVNPQQLIMAHWSSLGYALQVDLSFIADAITKLGIPSTEQLRDILRLRGVMFNQVGLDTVDELVNHWSGYFMGENFQQSSSQKGDVWKFKAGGSKAVVLDVAGTKLKLRLNGVETDWIEEAEVAKDAVKEIKV